MSPLNFSALLLLLAALDAQASLDPGAQKLSRVHEESAGVREIVENAEAEYGVACQGKSDPNGSAGRVTYQAECSGKTDLHIEITSSYQPTPKGYRFQVKYYSIRQ